MGRRLLPTYKSRGLKKALILVPVGLWQENLKCLLVLIM
jgi:hypothetical protein